MEKLNSEDNIVDVFSYVGESALPVQSVEVLTGCEPKVKCKNKLLQKVFVKMFGYKLTYETKQAKVLTLKAEDCPKGWHGIITFSAEE